MFSEPQVNDFQAVLVTEEATGREAMRLLIEVKRGSDSAAVRDLVGALIKRTLRSDAGCRGAAAGDAGGGIQRSIKAPRFVDKRV